MMNDNDRYIENIPCTLYHGITGMFHEMFGTIELIAIGCESSIYDGKAIVEMLLKNGCGDNVTIINTCAVTEPDKIISIETAELISKLYPGRKIVLTGCAVKYQREIFEKYGLCLDNFEKRDISRYSSLTFYGKKIDMISYDVHKRAALVSIQDGCSSNCAYCTIPKLRGPSVSVPVDDVMKQVAQAVDLGMCKIRITGSEICRYHSGEYDLEKLCKKILDDFPQLEKIEFNALDPASEQCEKIINMALVNDKLNDRFEFSTQSMDDCILKKMNRRHDVNRMLELGNLMGDKIEFSIHVIVGFPGETDEMFRNTCDNIKKLKPWLISIHPYSDREGTVASQMEDKIPEGVIKERCSILERMFEQYKIPDVVSNKTWSHNSKKYKLEITFRNFYQFYPLKENVLCVNSFETTDDMKYALDSGTKNVSVPLECIKDMTKFETFSRYMIWRHNFKVIIDIELNNDNIDKMIGSKDVVMHIQSMGCFSHFSLSDDFTEKNFSRLISFLGHVNMKMLMVFIRGLTEQQKTKYSFVLGVIDIDDWI